LLRYIKVLYRFSEIFSKTRTAPKSTFARATLHPNPLGELTAFFKVPKRLERERKRARKEGLIKKRGDNKGSKKEVKKILKN